MLRRLPNPVLLILAALLLAAVGYWNIDPDSFSGKPAQGDAQNAIDFYAINATTLQYQADGKLHYELTTAKVEHVNASDITLLTHPDLLLYRDSELPWHVRSERGEVAPQGAEVELIDQVRVERTDAKGRPIILSTSRLTVFPEKEYAQTRQAVRIDAANGVTTAQGMKAYLNDGRMLLLSNVRGQHEVR